jgi:hypothetical protein
MEASMSRRLGSKEVCDRLQKSYDWLRKTRKAPGSGPPCYRIGARYQYPVNEFEAWLEKQRFE